VLGQCIVAICNIVVGSCLYALCNVFSNSYIDGVVEITIKF
jgi:hypothetical protein